MKSFNEFLLNSGTSDPELLISFLVQFDENPGVLFELSDFEKERLDKMMDNAIKALCNI